MTGERITKELIHSKAHSTVRTDLSIFGHRFCGLGGLKPGWNGPAPSIASEARDKAAKDLRTVRSLNQLSKAAKALGRFEFVMDGGFVPNETWPWLGQEGRLE